MFDNNTKPEKAITVSFYPKGFDRTLAEEYLQELISLTSTAGAEIAENFSQEIDKLNPATAIGKGKVEEIKSYITDNEIETVIFGDDLSPVQKKNLEINFNAKVIDRSSLIIDIFSKHARSLESKTQVELAQLKYLLPRLTRMWTHLSIQLGGIGTKGPGETQIETDRRIIKLRIQKLEKKLAEIDVQREQQRKGRENLPRFALVGYTNAGKSTLMNVLTKADVFVEDKLFATLDTTVRSFELPSGRKSLISDTVGFIRKLPPNLIASFRSTLAESIEADILLHVTDISNPFFREHIQVVDDTLESLKIKDKPVISVFNKIDNLTDKNEIAYIHSEYPNSIMISAGRGINILTLLEKMQEKVDEFSTLTDILIPYSESKLLSKLFQFCEVIDSSENDEGYKMRIRIRSDFKNYFDNIFKKFEVE